MARQKDVEVTWRLLLLLGVLLVAVRQSSSSAVYVDGQDEDLYEPDASQLYSPEGDAETEAISSAAERNERRDRLKKLLLLALIKLTNEARNERQETPESYDDVIEEQKRGRWQGFCFRRTRSGRILPYICWKGSDF